MNIRFLSYSITILIIVIMLWTLKSNKFKNNRFYIPILSSFLALLIFISSLIVIKIWPFGNHIFSTVDLYAQYSSLLNDLKHNLLNNDLSLYSFTIGLGVNYLSLFAYYLASPINIILLLFNDAMIAEGILVVIAIKIALSAFTMALYLKYEYHTADYKVILCSLLYSGMMYLIAYSWNVMWLDGIYMLPLVMIGLRKILNGDRPYFYIFSLAYALYCNYYIGFMLCIFIVIYFIVELIISKNCNIKVLITFTYSSLIAGGLVMFLLLPTYSALKMTSATGGKIPSFKFNFNLIDFIGANLSNYKPTVRSGNMPNLQTGLISLIAVMMLPFIKDKQFKIKYLILFLIISLSLSINWLDLVWHGMHSPNDLPYRYSFIYSFIVINILFKHLNDESLLNKQFKYICLLLVIFVIGYGLYKNIKLEINSIYISLLFLIGYIIISFIYKNKYVYLFLFVILELIITNNLGYFNLKQSESMALKQNSFEGKNALLIYDVVDKLKEITYDTDNLSLYRTVVKPNYTLIAGAMYGYNGLTAFSSTNYYETTRMMNALGYASNGINSYIYKSFIPTVDSLLGIRYFISNLELSNHKQLKYVDSVTNGDFTYYIYRNIDALPLAFVTNDQIFKFEYDYYNPIKTQNNLYQALSNSDENIFECEQIYTDSEDVTIKNKTSFNIENVNETKKVEFNITTTIFGQQYIYVDCRAAKSLQINGVGNWSISPREPYMIDNAYANYGSKIKVMLETDKSCVGNVYVAIMNEELYRNIINEAKENELKITSFKNSKIKGYVNAKKDGAMFTSIPYDEGWCVKIDGEKVELRSIDNAFISFSVSEGYHDIELSYYPKMFKEGVIISFISLVGLLIVYLQNKNMVSQND